MFSLIEQVFIVFLSFSASLATKFTSLSNYPCITKPTFIDLNPDKHNQDLIHYIFMVNQIGRMCVPKKSEDVNLNVFIMVRRRNETKTLTKHI